jgi:dimethylglycine dehydrogenase
MEKSYRGWGAELTNEITPFEAGLGRLVSFDKGDFVGREACLAVRDQGCKIQLIYVEVDVSDVDVRGGDAVFFNGKVVGVTTSGGYGHTVQKSLAFAYVPPELTAPGTELEIKVFGEMCKARVLADLAYDPQNLRLRA